MTDLPDRDDLLPSWAGPLPLAVAKTEGRLDDVDMDRARRARDIEACSDIELLHLAAERSVDVYDPAWPREVRNAVVLAAPEVHATKGTPFAIRRALGAMRVTALLTEWWQATPRGTPGTFTVTALVGQRLYADQPILNERTTRAVYASVMRTKAHSRPFDFLIGIGMAQDVQIAAAGMAMVVDRHEVEAGPATGFASDVGLAAAGMAMVVDRREVEAGPATGFASDVGLAAAAAAFFILTLSAEAA